MSLKILKYRLQEASSDGTDPGAGAGTDPSPSADKWQGMADELLSDEGADWGDLDADTPAGELDTPAAPTPKIEAVPTPAEPAPAQQPQAAPPEQPKAQREVRLADGNEHDRRSAGRDRHQNAGDEVRTIDGSRSGTRKPASGHSRHRQRPPNRR